ncbi:hypothetical protein FN846DRAFT_321919 [Sphaerosporella brunnea]|uniref:Rhodopsin domain-containing protein n=1 Tax=Sphaerosporella brunnea TaxID=1250544 RepID=A0A5J5F690_9PEZI|nr:hypothetical protein FN846DRAFT_321919 [Sphaerosporella brunnea]
MLHGWATITIEWTLASLALIFVLLRIYVRFTTPSSVRYKLSDAIIIVAWLSLATMVSLDTAMAKLYLFEPGSFFNQPMIRKNDSVEENVQALQLLYGSAFPYTMSIYLVKAAIIAWYYSITPPTLARCRMALHVMCGCCIFGFLVAMGFSMLSCLPISRNWRLDQGFCIATAQMPTFFATFTCHVCTEIFIFVYPMPLLKIVPQRRRTCGIGFLFALGILSIIATLARVTAIGISATAPVVAVWTSVECSTGVIIACCPALRMLFQSKKPPVRLHFKSGSHTGQFNSTDTYVLTQTPRAGVMANEIWDGTDSTAPEWIKLGSRDAMHAMKMGGCAGGGRDIELGGCMGESHVLTHRAGLEGGYLSRPPMAYPGFVLQPGRGIIRHAPGVTASPPGPTGTPCWMNLPDPPFLSEKKKEAGEGAAAAAANEAKRISSSSESKVRCETEELGEQGEGAEGKEDDGIVLESRGRVGTLDRIVETLTEPAAAASKRCIWSQGSFGDRANHRRQKNNEEDKTALSKETLL